MEEEDCDGDGDEEEHEEVRSMDHTTVYCYAMIPERACIMHHAKTWENVQTTLSTRFDECPVCLRSE